MRRSLRLLLLVYLAVLGVAVFGPAPVDEIQGAARGLRELEQEVREQVGDDTSTTASSRPSPPSAPAPTVGPPAPDEGLLDVGTEEAFNAAAFVPLGLLVPLCWPRWRWLAVLVGAQLSGTIELVQDWFLDWRSPTITDVRWNTLGTAVGFAAWLVLHVAAPRLAGRLSGASDARARPHAG